MSKVTISVFVHLIFSSISCAKYKTICNLIKINVYLSFFFIYSFYFILFIFYLYYLFYLFYFLLLHILYLFGDTITSNTILFGGHVIFCHPIICKLLYWPIGQQLLVCKRDFFFKKNRLISRLLALNLNIKES